MSPELIFRLIEKQKTRVRISRSAWRSMSPELIFRLIEKQKTRVRISLKSIEIDVPIIRYLD